MDKENLTLNRKQKEIKMLNQTLAFFKSLTAHPFESEDAQTTLENEIRALGYQFEKSRRARVSLSKNIRDRHGKAMTWAASSKMSRTSFNFLLSEGEMVVRS